MTKTRWLLLKRPENLTEKQEVWLADLLRYHLRSVRSYLLKEDFQFFWGYRSPYWAGCFLDRSCHGLEVALYHALGTLLEPKFTHRFT